MRGGERVFKEPVQWVLPASPGAHGVGTSHQLHPEGLSVVPRARPQWPSLISFMYFLTHVIFMGVFSLNFMSKIPCVSNFEINFEFNALELIDIVVV